MHIEEQAAQCDDAAGAPRAMRDCNPNLPGPSEQAANAVAPLGASRRQCDSTRIARTLYERGRANPADHPFLTERGLRPGTLRELTAREVAEIAGDHPKQGSQQLTGRLLIALLVKLSPEGKTFSSNALLIDESGLEAKLNGCYEAGSFWPTSGLPEGNGDGQTMIVAERVIAALSARESSGHFAVAALSDANLEPVAEALKARYPNAEIAIVDVNTVDACEAAAIDPDGERCGPDLNASQSDCETNPNGLQGSDRRDERERPNGPAPSPGHSADAIECNMAPVDRATAQQEIARLAKLSKLDYERERKSAADRLGMRASALDEFVEKARGKESARPGQDVLFDDVKPSAFPVPLVRLLDDLSGLYSKHVVLPALAADALALWTIATWACKYTDHAPILLLRSPEPRCGKTTLLSLLAKVVDRPLAAANITPAAMFRIIEQRSPTLLIDEGDAFLGDNNELRGVINAGHTRATAYVIRTVGDDHEPRRFGVYGFKALALIGKAPHTITDRSIIINLRRKLPSDRVAKLRDLPKAKFDALRAGLARWALDNAHRLGSARPEVPGTLNDRAADSWQPLLSVADLAGGVWPQRARVAAVALSGHGEETSLGVELLADVRRVFEKGSTDRLAGADLVDALVADPERPWANFKNGQPLTQAQLASRLSTFDILSGPLRLRDGRNLRGYRIEQFADAFARYLTSIPSESVTTSQPNAGEGCDSASISHSEDSVTA